MSYSNIWEFYRSSEWTEFRKTYIAERLARDGELICDYSGKVIVKQYDAILHHKIELTESNVHDATIALNPDNIMLVTHQAHNQIHERFGYEGSRHIYIVWGSPCSGKREFVDANAGNNDLIVDFDRLYEAVNLGRSGNVKGNVLALQRALMDMVRTRNGKWRTAWIVRGLPLTVDRTNIVKEIGGGELIHIEKSKEECLIEAKHRGGDWIEWTEKYWERYIPPL